jgi:hypothetical protein
VFAGKDAAKIRHFYASVSQNSLTGCIGLLKGPTSRIKQAG